MAFDGTVFLENLSRYSEEGPGVTRLPFTEKSRGAWEYICQTMEGLGLEVKTDAYGSIAGHLAGQREEGIIIGSHYDSVVQGGKYDGALGIAVGLAAAAYFTEQGKTPPYSLDILAFNDEEGVTFANGFLSSKRICGLLKEEEFQNPVSGKSLKECLKEGWYITTPSKDGLLPGGTGGREAAKRGRDDIRLTTLLRHAKQYIEPHIEQGGILWDEGVSLGIVKGIVGITRLYVTVWGVSNHAGTTPMDKRTDALAAASRMISRIPELAERYEGAVATVGQIECSPNVINVIPGRVKFTVDIRSVSDTDRKNLEDEIRGLVKKESPLKAEISLGVKEPAVLLNGKMADRMEALCREKGFSYRLMNSGAGHDAQIMAGFLDTVMLFVPSKGGISHSPDEYTRAEDRERAVELLTAYLEEGAEDCRS